MVLGLSLGYFSTVLPLATSGLSKAHIQYLNFCILVIFLWHIGATPNIMLHKYSM